MTTPPAYATTARKTEPRRVAVIGAGRRARQTVLPALHCLAPRVEVLALAARREREVVLLDGGFRRRTVADLGALPFGEIDTVVVCVDRASVPEVLADLAARASAAGRGRDLTLVLDTPVLERHQLGAARHFGAFGEVLAGEDCVALPPFVAARRLLDEGRAGRLRHVELAHGGYRHHALATLGTLTGSRHARRIRITRWNRSCAAVDVRYPGGVTARILEPRRYESGRFLVAGADGMIADYDVGAKRATMLRCRLDGEGRFVGMEVDGTPAEPTEADEAFGARARGLEDFSLMGQLKVRGYMEVIAALDDAASPYRFDAWRSIHDNLQLQVAERLGIAVDVATPSGTSAATGALRAASTLAGSLGRLGAPRHRGD